MVRNGYRGILDNEVNKGYYASLADLRLKGLTTEKTT
jgi:hypothetical protein